MNLLLLLSAIVVILSIFFVRISKKSGIPVLIFFIGIGMFFGTDGLIGISFSDFSLTNNICSAALVFIMFYGGFGTSWKTARGIATEAGILSFFGVVLTALFLALILHFAFSFDFAYALLISSVLSSTDAASVFSILRAKRLSLKYSTAPLLEVESGSNDPAAYTMVLISLSLLNSSSGINILDITLLVFTQIVFGAGCGILIALAVSWYLKRKSIPEGFDSLFFLAVALLSYVLPSLANGNGYLSAYMCGIILGNIDIKNKKSLVTFFDSFNAMMQILIFFVLGLLAFPRQIISFWKTGLLIAVMISFVVRPVVVFLLTTPFKAGFPQQAVITFAGLRGASSIVFSIVAVEGGASDAIFSITFFVVIFSILFEGSLLPLVSRKLNMIDESEDVMRTFTDFEEDDSVDFLSFSVEKNSRYEDKAIKDIEFLPGSIVGAIKRENDVLVPDGNTVLRYGDTVVLGITKNKIDFDTGLKEEHIDSAHKWKDRKLSETGESGMLVLLIIRGNDKIIPNGETVIRKGDVLIYSKRQQ